MYGGFLDKKETMCGGDFQWAAKYAVTFSQKGW